jgi:hypothetical protein
MKNSLVFIISARPKPATFSACLAFALVRWFWMRAHFAGIERKSAFPWHKSQRKKRTVDNFSAVVVLSVAQKIGIVHKVCKLLNLLKIYPKEYKIIHFLYFIQRALC